MASSSSELRVMKRPGLGSAGAKVGLLCNYFAVKYVRTEDIFQYEVTISYANDPTRKQIISKNLCRMVISRLRQRENMGQDFLFDGDRNLYSLGRLPFEGAREFRITMSGADDPAAESSERRNKKRRNDPRDVKEFKVRVSFSVMIDMRSLEHLQRGFQSPRAQDALRVLDTLLKEQAARRGFLLLHDSYFHDSLGPVGDLNGGALSWVGYHASFRPSSGGFALNLDPSTTIVIKPQTVKSFVLEYLNKNNSTRELRLEDLAKVKRVLKGIEVQGFTGSKHKIFGFSELPASAQMFDLRTKRDPTEAPRSITVQAYYREKHGQNLVSPHFPCVNVGKASRPVYIPMELCKILPGQQYRKKLSGNQIRQHLQQARQNPGERVKVIQQGVNEVLRNSADLLSAFNVNVDNRMMRVQGRVLNPPKLKFGNCELFVKDGRWNYNTQTFVEPATINDWAVVSFGTSENEAREVAMRLKGCCERKGMKVPVPTHVIAEPPGQQGRSSEERVIRMMQELQARTPAGPPQFILCILPAKDSDLYAPFKRICWTKVGILNQCIVPPRNLKDQYLSNVALKVNAKNGGCFRAMCIVPPRNLKDQYLSNVALKVNAKNGGCNSFLSKEFSRTIPKVSQVPTLIVGMDVTHGTPCSSSSSIAAIVGSKNWPKFTQFVAKASTQPREYIANIVDETGIEIDGGPFGQLLRAFCDTCNKLPHNIVIFRDGVSESQFQSVLTVELQDIIRACHIFKPGYRPKLTLIVVQKRHHTRFFPEGRGDRNIDPGTVVDTGVCHPENFDFFLSSHKGLIGTTRPTHYIVLYDEVGFTPDEMQTFVNDMCYTYVKSTTAVSVVSPVYYAHIAASKYRLLQDDDGSDSGSSHAGSSHLASQAQGGNPPVRKLPPVGSRIINNMFWI